MRFGVVVFPGSNCDHDCYHVLKRVYRQDAELLWHKQDSVGEVDCVVLPGGFSYGDYLRTGAIARFSPIMQAVCRFAERGGMVLGICNGFQILLEAGLLPGAMMRNNQLSFICKHVWLRVESARTPFTSACREGQVLQVPIAHGEGHYYADAKTLERIEADGQVIFRYCGPDGKQTPGTNPNGSVGDIAGICNKDRNVMGMMPHPERCAEDIFLSSDGRRIFDSIISGSGLAAGRGA